jgi:hypothetical protein
MSQRSEIFRTEYLSFLDDVAQRLSEAQAFSGGFLSSEHCTDEGGVKEEMIRHYYLCAGAAKYFRETAPASLIRGSLETVN